MIKQEQQLVATARDGNAKAFGELVEGCQDRLLTSIIQIADSPEEAEDVVQEAFISAYLNLDRFRGQSSFYTWLFRIAINACATRRRRQRPTSSLDAILEDKGREPVAENTSPSFRMELDEQNAQVREAIKKLPKSFRAILVLREFEEFEYATIADMLKLNHGTVRSRLHRARTQFRREMRKLQTCSTHKSIPSEETASERRFHQQPLESTEPLSP